jgi:hypothetical protein
MQNFKISKLILPNPVIQANDVLIIERSVPTPSVS